MTSHNQQNYLNIINVSTHRARQERSAMCCPDREGVSSLPSNIILPEGRGFNQQGIFRELSEQAFDLLMQLWNILNGKVRYQFIARTIALKWRSAFDLALMGL